tara:strand:- start:5652 stop:7031 length:1380 start_codon:yes stop_codon:yes gene_type:complete
MNYSNNNLKEYSVSEISQAIKLQLEDNFSYVKIRGEISGFSVNNGHAYLKIKENDYVINAVIWNNVLRGLLTKPEDGLEVIVGGKITTWSRSGISRYQIQIESLQLAGEGALLLLYNKLKKKLSEEGLFDERFKKKLPRYPNRIAILTSLKGAVLRDILRVIKDHQYPINVDIYPVAVQGERCPDEVSETINRINLLSSKSDAYRPEIMIIARGGGSLEELWGFNSEKLARAVFNSDIPIISAIGHETDISLIDYIADCRAPTPTSAANIAIPILGQVQDLIEEQRKSILSVMSSQIETCAAECQIAIKSLSMNSYNKITSFQYKLKYLNSKISRKALLDNILVKKYKLESELNLYLINKKDFVQSKSNSINENYLAIYNNTIKKIPIRREQLAGFNRILNSLNYKNILKRGFAIVRDETQTIIPNQKIAEQKKKLNIVFSDGELNVINEKSIDKKHDV